MSRAASILSEGWYYELVNAFYEAGDKEAFGTVYAYASEQDPYRQH